MFPDPAPALFGLVLTGGRSSRMGFDKSTIDYHGRPQREYLYDRLSAYCREVYLSVNPEQAADLAGSRFRLILDQAPVEGPMAGILSAFQRPSASERSAPAWLVVACDLPLLSEGSIRKLIEHRRTDKIATAFWDSDHRFPEPSVCIWEPAAYPALLKAIEDRTPYPRRVLMNGPVQLVEIDDVRELSNFNDPVAVQRFGKPWNPDTV
ncbi:molybdenum cofactor guanylyltransferase [Larkinella soli]|uniref:molybdenum cofactor guanylyltransferase n=1 Tax=Larkinella soli TaxID=1770527 RepID=UPI000FFBC410|nr:NTP transferase domain-containing protein [Larkinella soli]